MLNKWITSNYLDMRMSKKGNQKIVIEFIKSLFIIESILIKEYTNLI
jgi:hypothetical protein